MLPGWLGLHGAALDVSSWTIATTVLIFLGIPLLAGYLTRTLGETLRTGLVRAHGVLPRISPVALYGLLFTVVILFALQGQHDHVPPVDRRVDRDAAVGLLRHHVDPRLLSLGGGCT